MPDHDPNSPTPSVDDLVVEILERTENAPEERASVLEELCDEWPERAERLRSAVRTLGHVGFIEVDELPESIGEFRPIRKLGGGGMGVVLLAEQPSLDRKVAIKLLRTDELLRSGARERFRREIEAVARLAHPNVVSVHAIGEERGTPYLVMDHVEGASLDAIVRAQAGRSPEELTGEDFLVAIRAELAARGLESDDGGAEWFDGTWTEVCLRVVRDVANALGHAHSRGVLHRDVKPSNVMLTASGRVQLVDFGLAAVADAERLTVSGTQLGSLPYMPPEHLEGRAEPDQRADVYSLGVTLFELLILDLPFPGRGTKRLRDDIENGRFVPPRRTNPAISQDLETVLRCACDPDPKRRYPTASAFASDLTNVLEGHAISARPAAVWRRGVRWVKRKPEFATLATIVAMLIVLGPISYGVVQRNHADEVTGLNEQLGKALDQQTKARERADGHFTRAREAILRVTGHMAQDGLEHEPRMQRARLGIAEDAIRLFSDIVAERPDDLEVLGQWARLHRIRGDILVELGSVEDGLADLRKHNETYSRMLEMDPTSVRNRYELGSGRSQEAGALRRLGRFEESIEMYEVAGEDILAANEADGEKILYRTTFVLNDVYRAAALFALGDIDRAESVLTGVQPYAEALVEDRGDRDRSHIAYAQFARTMAGACDLEGDFEGMEYWGGRTAAAARRALALAPGHRTHLGIMSDGLYRQAFGMTRLKKFDEALEVLDELDDLTADLLLRYPSVYSYNERKVELWSLRSLVEAERGRYPEAIEHAEAAVLAQEEYCELEPDSITGRVKAASLRAELAGRVVMYASLGDDRFERAETHARTALETLLALEALGVQSRNARQLALYNLVLSLTGQDLVQPSRRAVQDLAGVTREHAQELRLLADAWCELYLVTIRVGAPDAAALESALETLERAVAAGYRDHRELSSTPALDPLRTNARFVELLQRATDRQ